MRHFIVLGFTSMSQKAQGKSLHLGNDRARAIEEVNKTSGNYVRRELYELAMPHIRRHKRGELSDGEKQAKAAKEEAAAKQAEAEKKAEEARLAEEERLAEEARLAEESEQSESTDQGTAEADE